MTLKEEISSLQRFGTALNQKLSEFDPDADTFYWVLVELKNNKGWLIDFGHENGELGYVTMPSRELRKLIPQITDDLSFKPEVDDDFTRTKAALQKQFGLYIDQIVKSPLVESLNIYKEEAEVYTFVAHESAEVFWTHEMLETLTRTIAEKLNEDEHLAVKLSDGEGFFVSNTSPGNRIVSWYDDSFAFSLMPGHYATNFDSERYKELGDSSLMKTLFQYSEVDEVRIYDEHVCRWYKLQQN